MKRNAEWCSKKRTISSVAPLLMSWVVFNRSLYLFEL